MNVNKLETPCDCLDGKLALYQELNIFHENHLLLIQGGQRNLKNIDLKDVDDFSYMFKLMQKIEEIDFKIHLNSWSLDIKNCSNYALFDSIYDNFTQ